MSDGTYQMTVEYEDVGGYSSTRYRWRWVVTKTVKKGTYTNDTTTIKGTSRFRWRAVRKANKTLNRLQNGINRTTDMNDLAKRITVMERELGMVTT